MAIDSQSKKIGEFLIKIGAMQTWQVEEIQRAQKSGDLRMFGELAIVRGYIDDKALMLYVESHPKLTRERA